jgi:hypothetical protein
MIKKAASMARKGLIRPRSKRYKLPKKAAISANTGFFPLFGKIRLAQQYTRTVHPYTQTRAPALIRAKAVRLEAVTSKPRAVSVERGA